MDAPDIIVESRNTAFCDVPQMDRGNQPTDGGNLIIEAADLPPFIAEWEGRASRDRAVTDVTSTSLPPYIKLLLGAKEFLHNLPRYCLWLKDVEPSALHRLPLVLERVAKCREWRQTCKDAGAHKLAFTSGFFREQNNPKTAIIVPCTTSENREYIPIGFIDDSIIVTNLVQLIPDATLYHFGILTSRMHNAWMRAVAGG